LNDDEIKIIEDTYLARVYQKFLRSIVKGEGAFLYDINNKKYIDCMSGYGVSLVGHCNQKVVNAIQEQCKKLITCHGSYYNDKRAELTKKLIQICPKGLNKIFLSNSGAESVECALKASVKYTGNKEIIGMIRGYHGKTIGALSATWNPKYRKSFRSLICQNFKFIPFGNIEKAKEAITSETAAIIVEPILGEGGIHIAPDGYLQGLQDICKKQNIVLIFDEIQTGFGRTGYMWASEHWGVTPDIMCISKAMGGGVPIGATIGKKEIMDSLQIGEHSSTFGGNPLACAAASATIDVILEEKLPYKALKLGTYFINRLQEIVDDFRILREVRGLGLMIGLESRVFIFDILINALQKGLILLYSGKNVIRFLPPLVISIDQIDNTIEILEDTLKKEEKKLNRT
jgi:acetylornithine/LysW-gamma-L-lysine aminotransferase